MPRLLMVDLGRCGSVLPQLRMGMPFAIQPIIPAVGMEGCYIVQ